MVREREVDQTKRYKTVTNTDTRILERHIDRGRHAVGYMYSGARKKN